MLCHASVTRIECLRALYLFARRLPREFCFKSGARALAGDLFVRSGLDITRTVKRCAPNLLLNGGGGREAAGGGARADGEGQPHEANPPWSRASPPQSALRADSSSIEEEQASRPPARAAPSCARWDRGALCECGSRRESLPPVRHPRSTPSPARESSAAAVSAGSIHPYRKRARW
jgi:hypothetical protein